MLQCKEIDELMMDWLYQELDASSSQAVEAHVGGCARCAAEVGSLRRTRDVFREFDAEEPPPALSAILLHEAARRAPATAAARGREVGFGAGFIDRVRAWFQPLVAHPAAAAVATLVLVAGVAGALYVRRGSDMTDAGRAPVATSSAPAAGAPTGRVVGPVTATPAPAAEPALEAQQAQGEAGAMPEPNPPADGFTASLLDEKTQADLRREDQSKGDLAKGAARREQKNRAPSDDADLAYADADKAAKPSKKLRKAKEPPQASVANAVSGADPLIGGVESGGMRGGGAFDAPAAPPSTTASKSEAADGRFRPYRDRKPLTPEEQKWLAGKETRLSSAVKAKRCSEAATIANDILDRNPDYYTDRVAVTTKTCQMAINTEKNRRAVARSRNVGDGSSQAAPRQKARAAPAEADEAAAESPAAAD